MIREMKKRAELLSRLEGLAPALQRRAGESRSRATVVSRYGGVTLHQVGALRHLVKDGPLTMHELASRMEISASSATQLVDRLVQHGLVDRIPDPADRRVHRLAVAAAASDVVRDLEQERSRRLATLLAPLTEDELQVLVSLAQRIADHDGQAESSPRPPTAARRQPHTNGARQ
jgi:DNA-binding MarR family transcriptional regulator